MRRILVPLLAALLIPAAAAAQVTSRNITLMSAWNEFGPDYSACWSYIHHDGREYAVIGCFTGTAIYNVTNPANSYRVGFIPGSQSQWREMKSYRDWIYVVSEGTGAGLQIISMVNPEAPVLAATVSAQFSRAHTVSVDTTRALLICNGTNNGAGANGMHIYSLAGPGGPTVPVALSRWPAGTGVVSQTNYIHDCVPIGNRLYASSIYAGIERIIDITNPAVPNQLSSWTYPGAFTHNSWPDPTGQWLYVTDEVNGETLKIFDISNVAAPVLVNGITSNPQAIVHNAHVMGGELYLSNYTEGIRILDIADPAHPAEFAYADSWPGVSGGFHGVWAVCPYFPSGTVIASDIETGLYVYRATRDYGVLRVEVETEGATAVDACANEPGGCCCAPFPCTCGDGSHLMAAGAGVKVTMTTTGDSITTGSDGIVQFAPNPGTHTVVARRFGWATQTATRTLTAGGRDTVVLFMPQLAVGDFTGVVKAFGTGTPLPDAQVDLLYTPLHDHTDAAGAFLLPGVPNDEYRVEVRRPGSIARSELHTVGPGNTSFDFELRPTATWDALESASGWTVGGAGTGDNATSGIWVRAEPLGTGAPQPGPAARPEVLPDLSSNGVRRMPVGRMSAGGGLGVQHEGHEEDGAVPGDVQPELDRTPAPGTICFVTGQGTTPTNIGEADVDNGRTSLTTPLLNLTGMTDPMVTWWEWFYANDSGMADGLIAQISNNNGASWTAVDTTQGLHNHWAERSVRIADYVAPTGQVRMRFVAMDIGTQGIVEASIDDLATWDLATLVDARPSAPPARLAFQAPRPNPARGEVRFTLDLPSAGRVRVDVHDLQGRRVRTVFDADAAAGPLALSWDGRGADGAPVAAGVYYARARVGGAETTARFVRVR